MTIDAAGFNPVETASKQRDFAKMLDWYCPWASRTVIKYDWASIIYLDCNAGPGNYAHRGHNEIDGSPLIAMSRLQQAFGQHLGRVVFIEENVREYQRLMGELFRRDIDCHEIKDPSDFRDIQQRGGSQVLTYCGDNRSVAHNLRADKWQFALIYHDANGQVQYDLLSILYGKMPKADLLVNLNSVAHKRNRLQTHQTRMLDDLNGSLPNKNMFIVDNLHGQWQWLMSMMTEHPECNDWPGHGILAVRKRQRAADVLEKAIYTKDELQDGDQLTLPFG